MSNGVTVSVTTCDLCMPVIYIRPLQYVQSRHSESAGSLAS